MLLVAVILGQIGHFLAYVPAHRKKPGKPTVEHQCFLIIRFPKFSFFLIVKFVRKLHVSFCSSFIFENTKFHT